MNWKRWALYGLAGLAGLIVLVVGLVAFLAHATRAREIATHDGGFEPTSGEEAVARGKHLVEARYGCEDCHGKDFGGGVMVDSPALGTFLGPNLTSGEGGVVRDYRPTDWDRIVRHGVLPDGRPAMMPSVDFFTMSDGELADIVAYIESLPPVDRDMGEAVTLGPVGTMLVATGAFVFAADRRDHQEAHPTVSPEPADTLAFGEHLAGPCRGCHGTALNGGPIVGGDPSWPPAANLTRDMDAWTYEQFVTALRDGETPDGRRLEEPMTFLEPYARRMTDIELRALWRYLSSLDAIPTGGA